MFWKCKKSDETDILSSKTDTVWINILNVTVTNKLFCLETEMLDVFFYPLLSFTYQTSISQKWKTQVEHFSLNRLLPKKIL